MSAPLSVVCWKWHRGDYRKPFTAAMVNTLASMVARHYPHPHRFICVTNDREGIDSSVETVPDHEDFATLPSPHGATGRYPSCYRRLRSFHPEIGQVFGPRFVQLDLDCVITGDMTPVWNRPEDFVIWGDTNPRTLYNGSMYILTSGARPNVWTTFDPRTSPQRALSAGNHGSDQAWISYCLGPGEARWSRRDGVYSFRNEIAQDMKQLPDDARIVFFHGNYNPGDAYVQTNCPWAREHYQ